MNHLRSTSSKQSNLAFIHYINITLLRFQIIFSSVKQMGLEAPPAKTKSDKINISEKWLCSHRRSYIIIIIHTLCPKYICHPVIKPYLWIRLFICQINQFILETSTCTWQKGKFVHLLVYLGSSSAAVCPACLYFLGFSLYAVPFLHLFSKYPWFAVSIQCKQKSQPPTTPAYSHLLYA